MKTGTIDDSIKKTFNSSQISEEILKITWLESNENQAESLFELEDHDFLQGQIGIVGLDNPEYFQRFKSLFSCSLDIIDCALMSIGNYGQKEKNGWRYQLGSKKNIKAWRNLFHKSGNEGFERTKDILMKLLSRTESFTDDFLSEIINDYISYCEQNKHFEWRYYYIKYDVFRPGSFGKYNWNDFNNKPYEFSSMQTESQISANTYQPFLKIIDKNNLSKDHNGQRIYWGDKYVECENSAYIIKDIETNEEVDRITIMQSDEGIDAEDRIQIALLNFRSDQ
jgi:hypothetical protein